MNLFKIAFSNMKKRKGAAITLLCMILIASIMLMVGLNLVLNLSSFYDKKVEELKGPHYISFVKESIWNDDVLRFAKSHENVIVAEAENCLQYANAGIKANDTDTSTNLYAYNMENAREIAPLNIIDKLGNIPDNAAVVPLFLKLSEGCRSGDELSIIINANTYTFTIYGFFEDTMCGANTISIKRYYLNNSAFQTLSADSNFLKARTLSVRLADIGNIQAFEKAYKKVIYGSSNEMFNFSYAAGKNSATSFLGLMGAIVIVFAILIFGISVIIIRFNIYNSIDEDIKNFGAFKSIGYTAKQVIISILIQYLLIAACAAVLGIALGLAVMPYVGNIVAANSGLLWLKGFSPLPVLITLFLILGITALIAYLTGRKSKKITPVNALRQGLDTHNYEKSRVPISNNKLPLHFNLGLKGFLSNLKNNITFFAVIALFTFACVLSNVLHYNFVTEQTAVSQMIGLEDAEVIITFLTDNNEEMISTVQNDNRVRKTILYDDIYISASDMEFGLTVTNDFSAFETNTIIKGRAPQSAGEMSVSGIMSELTGKKIGDMIYIELGAASAEYLITGITQAINNGGYLCAMTTEGVKRLNPDFEVRSLYVFLNDASATKEFIVHYNSEFAGYAINIDFGKLLGDQINSLAATISVLVILIIIVTVIVIALVLFLFISTLIRKMKKTIGILKALGYSDFQLMRQIIYTFLPSAIVGSIAGILLGVFASNGVCSLMLGSMGILKATFLVPLLAAFLIGFVMIALNLIITMLVSLRIKKITAYKLIVE